MKLTSTSLNNRIEALDLIRGFSLLGILIANMLMFHSPYLYIDPYTFFASGSDPAAYRWIDIFVQSSFYPIFAFLFGYGINMQYEKALERNQPFAKTMARRFGVLLSFGLVHALFIWSGDILFTYALFGFLLIFFVRIPAKWLVPFAFVLYVIPMGFLYFMTKAIVNINPNLFAEEMSDTQLIEHAISVFGEGSFGEIFSFRLIEWATFGLSSTFAGIFIVLPIIMLGAAMSKWKVIERAAELKGRLLFVTVIALPVGIWIKSLPYMGELTYDVIQLQDSFGGVILAIGYVSLLLLFCTSPLFRKVFGPVGKAGRMSLTTYITQSIVATLIFYAYGFGLYGKIDVQTGTWLAIGLFAIQVLVAELWFSKFRIGPLEALWRFGTYGKNSTK